ncbi:MAG: response regulator [Verrucomicrobia bacterium]|nr:response regulator [Verrucomicrobiota bacterium]
MSSEQKGLRILMVEDAEDDAVLINHELHRGGLAFHATRVETQEEFLRELTHNTPDLILSDHGLSSFDGFEALNLVQERCPDVPFIFVTGSQDEAQARTALRCGARAWIPKSNLSGIVPVVHDAVRLTEERTQRRLAEEKIREHAEQLRVVFSELKGCAVFTLGHDGRVAEWNAGAAVLFGFTADKIVGRHFGCLYRPEDRAIGKPRLDLSLAADGRHEEEGWRVRPDGTQF